MGNNVGLLLTSESLWSLPQNIKDPGRCLVMHPPPRPPAPSKCCPPFLSMHGQVSSPPSVRVRLATSGHDFGCHMRGSAQACTACSCTQSIAIHVRVFKGLDFLTLTSQEAEARFSPLQELSSCVARGRHRCYPVATKAPCRAVRACIPCPDS